MKRDKPKKQIATKQVAPPPVRAGRISFSDFVSQDKNKRMLGAIAIIIAAVAIIPYYFYLFRDSYNFPFFDDSPGILGFLNSFISSHDFHEKMHLLFKQHNEHRIVFIRVVALSEYLIFGEIDFKSFIIIGNSALLGILLMIYKSFRLKHKTHFIYLAPIAITLFNFRYWETSFWPSAALQNIWVLCFVLSALYFFFKETPQAIYIAILLGLLATFCSANGMMVFAAGGLVLVMNKQIFSRKSMIWLLGGAIAFGGYFYHYIKPEGHPDIIKHIISNPFNFLAYFFGFLGGALSESAPVAVGIGVVLLLIILYITYRQYYKQNPIIYSLMIFILITAFLAALARSGFGVDQALSSKYTISSVLLVICCYIALVSMAYRKMRAIYLVLITGLAFYFQYYTFSKYLPAKESEKQEFEKNYALITHGRLSNFNFGWPAWHEEKQTPRRLLKTADSLGYFSFKFKTEDEILKGIPSVEGKEIIFKLDRYERLPLNALIMAGSAFIRNVDPVNQMTVLCFRDEQGNPAKYIICRKYWHAGITQANANDNTNYDMSGFVVEFNENEIKPGRYILSVIIVDDKYKAELNTGQAVEFSKRE